MQMCMCCGMLSPCNMQATAILTCFCHKLDQLQLGAHMSQVFNIYVNTIGDLCRRCEEPMAYFLSQRLA